MIGIIFSIGMRMFYFSGSLNLLFWITMIIGWAFYTIGLIVKTIFEIITSVEL